MKRISALIVFSVCLLSASAQMTIETAATVEDYVQNVLVGEGVSISNVTFNGEPGNMLNLQMGYFESNGSYMPIDSGLVLSSGNVINGVSGAIVGEETSITVGNSSGNDPDLVDISGGVINDHAVLEFDFVPQGDTLRFNYVFGSEEYPEFVNSFNDAFGFFLAGPGISGPYSSPAGFPSGSANIALVPGTTTPVTIDNVNNGNFSCPGPPSGPCTNCDYYVDNCAIESQALDGMTTVLEAFALVECGATYHIKLAIGDASDFAFDSAVFLEAGSFESEPTGIVLESIFPLGLVEISNSCDTGVARIARACAGDSTFFHLNYLVNDTTAEYGVDYEDMPLDIVMIPGQSEEFIAINTIPDGEDEPIEWICIELSQAVHPDSMYTIIDTACVAIIDNYTFPATVNDQQVYCPEDVPLFNGMPQYPGVSPYTYEWFLDGVSVSTDNPYEPPLPGQLDTTYYELVVTDFCGALSDPISPYITNYIADDPSIEIASDGDYCPGVEYELTALRNGGTGPHNYTWWDTTDPTQTYENAQTILVDPASIYGTSLSSIIYMVAYADDCDPTRVDTSSITVTFPTPLATEAYMNSQICTDQILEIETTSSGGYPPYTYTWTSSPQLVPTTYFPLEFGFLPGTEGSYTASGFLAGEAGNPNNQYLINLTLDDWCSIESPILLGAMDTDTVISIDCIYPNVVSPNGDGSNDSFLVNELINRPGTMFIYNRWGNLLKETSSNEWNIGDEPEGTYFYVVQFDDEEDDNERKGSFTIMR